MNYIDDAAYFKDAPYMSNGPGIGVDGNALLYNGTRIVMRADGLIVTKEDIDQFNDAVNKAWVEPGLLNRGGKPGDLQAYDDYVGIAAGAAFVNPDIAKVIASYGMNHCWYYANVKGLPCSRNLGFIFGIKPGIPEHFKLAAGIDLNIFEQCLLAGSIVATTFSSPFSASGRILAWLQIKTFKNSNRKYWVMDWAAKVWEKDIIKRYPNKMGDVFGIYFSYKHPFSIYMTGKI